MLLKINQFFLRQKVLCSVFLSFLISNSVSAKNGKDEKKEKITVMVKNIEKLIEAPTLSVKKYKEVKNEKTILIDVRPKNERDVSVIPGAISIEEFEKNKNKYKKHKVVSYCTIGYRSGKYTQKLQSDGFDAWNLEGGILLWLHGQNKVVDQEKIETKKVHVYGDRWDLAPEGYKTLVNPSLLESIIGK